MSLRYMGRVMYQAAGNLRVAALQGAKLDQAASSKCDSALKSTKSSAFHGGRTRRFTTATDKVRLAEESLRAVMYLSCWGPF